MKLYIDTSQREHITIGLNDKRFQTESRADKSQKLLAFITEILKKENKTLQDIAEISVEEGPGSFTGLRVGLTVANTLGWALAIPVNGKKITTGEIIEPRYS